MSSVSGSSDMAQRFVALQLLIDEIMETDDESDEDEVLMVVSCNIILKFFLQVNFFSRHELNYSGMDQVPKLPAAEFQKLFFLNVKWYFQTKSSNKFENYQVALLVCLTC